MKSCRSFSFLALSAKFCLTKNKLLGGELLKKVVPIVVTGIATAVVGLATRSHYLSQASTIHPVVFTGSVDDPTPAPTPPPQVKAAPAPPKRPPSAAISYHSAVTTTIFWIGEGAGPENLGISNTSSAWDDSWTTHYGGVDDPARHRSFWPSSFKPLENPFYFALPYNDYTAQGKLKASAKQYCPTGCKNRWIEIRHNGKLAYAQWEDVGPNNEDDVGYVFGSARPASSFNKHAGLDVSPAVRDFLTLEDVDQTDWRFVSYSQVPAGPWREIITTRPVSWQ
jgi:hypothetical protein